MAQIQLTIIGLGQIGASVGLALAEHKQQVLRVGHDRDPLVTRQIEPKGIVDKSHFNVHSAVEDADIVLLAVPMDQMRDMLELIAGSLKEKALVVDMAPVKAPMQQWAKDLLPAGRFYVGLCPLLNPEYLDVHGSGLNAARADLFKNGMMAIVAPPGTPEGVMNVTSQLIYLLGAHHIFFDMTELDSLMATMHLMPQLLSAALVDATVGQPGWREAIKVGGRAYARLTGPLSDLGNADALTSAALQSQEALVRALDRVMAVLQTLRDEVSREDGAALQAHLRNIYTRQNSWMSDRRTLRFDDGIPATEMPRASEVYGSLFGLGGRRRGDPARKK